MLMAAERMPVGQIVGSFKTAVVISCKFRGPQFGSADCHVNNHLIPKDVEL